MEEGSYKPMFEYNVDSSRFDCDDSSEDLEFVTVDAEPPIRQSVVLNYSMDMHYATTPRGSEKNLNYIRPSTAEDYYRLSQMLQQQNNINTGYVEPKYTRVVKEESKAVPSPHSKLAMLSFVCFFPIGIIALVKSMQTRNALQRKDKRNADDLSETTRFFAILAILLGIIMLSISAAVRAKYAYENDDNFFPSSR